MKNTLKIALMVIGIALIGFGLYNLIFVRPPLDQVNAGIKDSGNIKQALAMIGFGALCLISGIGYSRKRR